MAYINANIPTYIKFLVWIREASLILSNRLKLPKITLANRKAKIIEFVQLIIIKAKLVSIFNYVYVYLNIILICLKINFFMYILIIINGKNSGICKKFKHFGKFR